MHMIRNIQVSNESQPKQTPERYDLTPIVILFDKNTPKSAACPYNINYKIPQIARPLNDRHSHRVNYKILTQWS